MTNLLRAARLLPVLAALTMSACVDRTVAPSTDGGELSFAAATTPEVRVLAAPGRDAASYMRKINAQLAARGLRVAVREANISFSDADKEREATVIANDRKRRAGYKFVVFDPRRPTKNGFLRQSIFSPFAQAPTGTAFIPGTPSINASFHTWTAQECSRLEIVANALEPNIVPSALLAVGGFVNEPLVSDVNTLGFVPGFIFDQVLGPGSSTTVLGVTFPFVWLDEKGNPTDIDHDGLDDLAFAEIWYNGAFSWTNTGRGKEIDIQTVSLHENGHALGLNHFGKIVLTANGKLEATPRAVMNAYIIGTLRELRPTDQDTYCGLWRNFPN